MYQRQTFLSLTTTRCFPLRTKEVRTAHSKYFPRFIYNTAYVHDFVYMYYSYLQLSVD